MRSGDDSRDNSILGHIGRYTISVRPVIESLYFEGRSCGNTLQRLAERELIQRVRNTLHGNYSYYQLTAKGAKSQGLPSNRASSKRETALAQNLAALWFACKGEQRRKRLSDEELDTLFGAPKGGNVIHVAQDEPEDTAVFRLFVPSEVTDITKGYVTTFRATAFDAISNQRLVPWIERGTYRFAILVHSKAREQKLDRMIRTSDFPKLRIHIEVVPTPTTLPEFLGPEDDAQ